MAAKMQVTSDYNRVWINAALVGPCGEELAIAKGALRLTQRSMRVLWLGRSDSRPVHPSIQGVSAYAVGDDVSLKLVTTTVALLGVLASFARWFGTSVVQLCAVDDDSGRLANYFHSLGFSACADNPEYFTAPCGELRRKCCPCSWLAELPLEGELGMLRGLLCEENDN